MPAKPTVSVSEAFGLPDNWSMQSSLNPSIPGSRTAAEVNAESAEEPSTPEPAAPKEPNPPVEPAPPAAAGESTPATDAAPAKDKGAAKPTPAKPGKPVKTSTKPAADKPAATPATPPAPVAPAAAAMPAPEQKVKVGDKEYTPKELEALVTKATAPALAPAAAPKPEPIEPTPTKEELERQQTELRQKETEWLTNTAKELDAPIDEATFEKIMTGGKEGMEALQQLRRQDMAQAILYARKSIFSQVEPVIKSIRDSIAPIAADRERVESERMESDFKTKFPELADRMDVVGMVASSLAKQQPDTIASLQPQAYFELVAKSTKEFITKMGGTVPVITPAAPAASNAVPGAAVPAAPAAPAGTPPANVPVSRPAAVRAAVKPPGANLPAPTPAKGGRGSKDPETRAIINSLL